MSIVLAGCAVIFFSGLGYWRPSPLPFMLSAGAALMLGLQWFDTYTTNIGLSVSMMLILYSFVCVAYAYGLIFWKDRLHD
jgi:hypothetical protein